MWGTPTGDLSDTKARILKRTEEARDLLRHHPLAPEQAVDLFTRIGIGAFRYSAALVPWTERELQQLEAVWVQAYKWAWGLPWTTASDVFTLPSGMEYPRPLGIMAQELCRHLQRCLKHEDVTRQLTLRDLNLACKQWACGSLRELKDEMEVWKWDLALSNRLSRLAKCMHRLDIPVECVGDTNETQKRVWAEGQQASAAESIRGDTRSTTDLSGTPEPHRANEERPERKDLMWMKTKRQILLGANVGG